MSSRSESSRLNSEGSGLGGSAVINRYEHRSHTIEQTDWGWLVARGNAYLQTTGRYGIRPDGPASSAFYRDEVAAQQAINQMMGFNRRRA